MRTFYVKFFEEVDHWCSRCQTWGCRKSLSFVDDKIYSLHIEEKGDILTFEDFQDLVNSFSLDVDKRDFIAFEDEKIFEGKNAQDAFDYFYEIVDEMLPSRNDVALEKAKQKAEEERFAKKKVYVFIRTDLSLAQQLVQVGHASYQAGAEFLNPKWVPSLILLQVPSQEDLLVTSEYLKEKNIKHHLFHEPHYEMGYSAIGTEPLFEKDWPLLSHYSLWTGPLILPLTDSGQNNKWLQPWEIPYINKRNRDWNNSNSEDISPCLHERCPECKGTGIKKGGRICVHHLSCSCSRCRVC